MWLLTHAEWAWLKPLFPREQSQAHEEVEIAPGLKTSCLLRGLFFVLESENLSPVCFVCLFVLVQPPITREGQTSKAGLRFLSCMTIFSILLGSLWYLHISKASCWVTMPAPSTWLDSTVASTWSGVRCLEQCHMLLYTHTRIDHSLHLQLMPPVYGGQTPEGSLQNNYTYAVGGGNSNSTPSLFTSQHQTTPGKLYIQEPQEH